MGQASNKINALGTPGRSCLHLLFPGDAHSVRKALKSAMLVFRGMDLGEELNGVVEIVLAEVLNNVVEHAYEDHGRGLIELDVREEGDTLVFQIFDDGKPMPDEEIPAGKAHDLSVARDHLPEGGFGWFLIRELTEGLSYTRTPGRNSLRFSMPTRRTPRAN